MIPIVLDPGLVRLALVGRGPIAARRLGQLRDGGADPAVFSDAPSGDLAALAGPALVPRLPDPADLDGVAVLWIVDLPVDLAEPLARAARAGGMLVNVEDVKPLCDFHSPSLVRRGDLLLTVSTGGRSPGMAVAIRRRLEALFGPEWAERLDALAGWRNGWREEGLALDEVARLTDARIDREGWLR